MTRVDFYLLPQHDEKSRQIFACRLAEKAWQLDNRTLIQTTDNETGSALNALLWTFKADSFLPHAILPASQQTPVHIGWQGESSSHHDLLINLSADVPTFLAALRAWLKLSRRMNCNCLSAANAFVFIKNAAMTSRSTT